MLISDVKPQCKICSKGNVFLVYQMPRFDLYECGNCSHLFSLVKVKQETYSEDYYLEKNKDYFCTPDNKLYSKIHQLIVKHQSRKANTTLLDVGTAVGLLPRHFNELGYECWGIDTSVDAVRYGTEKLKVPRLEAVSVDMFHPNRDFDVLTNIYVIEHVEDPVGFLTSIRKLIEREGIFICITVNSKSLLYWLAKLLYKLSNGVLFSPLERLCEVHHLHHFNQSSFARALDEAGFIIVDRFDLNLPVDSLTMSSLQKLAVKTLYLLSPLINSYFLQGVVCKRK